MTNLVATLPCPALPCPALRCAALRCAVLRCAVLCSAVLWQHLEEGRDRVHDVVYNLTALALAIFGDGLRARVLRASLFLFTAPARSVFFLPFVTTTREV